MQKVSPREVIKRPIVTEKSLRLRDEENKYVFEVDKRANKNTVKKAVEEIFNVRVKKVHIMNIKPKPKRLGRYTGRSSGWKKAIVTLEQGEKIEELLGGG